MSHKSYLTLANEVLFELNEVPLASSNFQAARGIQQFVKNSINRAYFDIVNENPMFSFLAADNEAGVDDDSYGNTLTTTAVGQRWYYLKDNSTGAHGAEKDFGKVDWDKFYLTTEGVAGETVPHTRAELKFITIDEWTKFYRASDDADKDSDTYSQPLRVIRSSCGRKFGLSPMPDKVYNILFNAWEQAEELVAHDDEMLLPEQWSSVLLARARYYAWQFKEDVQLAALSLDEYKKGMNLMRTSLGKPQPSVMTDDRIRYV